MCTGRTHLSAYLQAVSLENGPDDQSPFSRVPDFSACLRQREDILGLYTSARHPAGIRSPATCRADVCLGTTIFSRIVHIIAKFPELWLYRDPQPFYPAIPALG